MSQKTTTNTQNGYNQAGMTNYNNFAGQLGQSLGAMANNPLGNSMFANQLGQSLGAASQIGQRNIANTMSNLKTGGGLLGNSAGYMNASLNRTMMGNSGMQANAFNSSLQSALGNRNFALQGMEGYNPLQTSANTTQSTSSGIGGVLGSLGSAALGMAMPGIGGMLGGGGFKSGYGGGGGNPYQSIYNAQQGSNMQTENPFVGAGV